MPVNLFDANFYRAANPDLTELNDCQAFSHFQTFGLNEGREFSPFVNLNFYRSSSSDLANLNNQQVYNHLQNNGIAEGRSFSPFVDLNFYRAANSDLASLNNKQALQHLEIYGLNEGRDFSLPFDLDYYKSHNSDLVAAGLNNSQLLQHFELHGLNEGRASSPELNVSYYLSHNPDLGAAGFNFKQAYNHYVLYGYNEGRLGAAPPTRQWIQEFGTSSYDSSNGVAVDSAGNIYITGDTDNSLAGTNAGGSDAWVAKYDNSGARLWLQQFGTVGSDSANDLAVDSAGNIYITGVTNGSLASTNAGNTDAWTAKYDNSGNRLWIQQFGTSASDVANGIAVDTGGNIYITGDTDGSLGGANAGHSDAWLTKYDSSGNRLWLHQYGTANGEESNDVAVDSAGNIFLAGNTSIYSSDISDPNQEYVVNQDGWVAKYDNGGNQLWLQQLITNGYDTYNRVAVDSAGNVYIAGNSDGLGGEVSGINYALVAKYDTSGNSLWIEDFGSYNYNQSYGIAVNSAGSVYITGINIDTHSGGSSSWVTKYDSIGHQLWKQDFGSSSLYNRASAENSYGIALDSTGNFYLTGNIYNLVDGTYVGNGPMPG